MTTFVWSPSLPVVLELPFASTDEVRTSMESALHEGRFWSFVDEVGASALINPAAVALMTVSPIAPPAWAADRPVLKLGPIWSAPDTLPDELVGSDGEVSPAAAPESG